MLQMFAATAALLMIAAVQTPLPKPNASAEPPADAAVVLTGCLTASTEGSKTRYMLINGSPAPAGGDEAPTRAPETGSTGVGTTGTGTSGTGTSATPTTAQDTAQVAVVLTTGRGVSLRPHVNHQVEVHGTLEPAAKSATADEPRELRVSKVRRVPGACSGKK